MKNLNPSYVKYRTGSGMRYRTWSWSTILASVLICAMVIGLNLRQNQLLAQATDVLTSLHLARIELTKGFLYVILSSEPDAPYSREEGLVLLQQASVSLEEVSANLDMVLTAEDALAFQQDLDAFQAHLTTFQAADRSTPALETELRIAFHDLEKQANMVDEQAHQQLNALQQGFTLQFLGVLGLAVILLTSISVVSIQTERAKQRLDQSLKESEARYRTLFEAFPLGITVADAAGNILETNRVAEELLGISIEEQKQREIDGTEWHIIRPDGTLMPTEEFPSVRALKEGQKVENVEMGIQKPDGETTWINVTAAPLPVDEHGVVVTYGDITERKQADKLIQEARDQFQHLFNMSPIATTFTSLPERLFLDVNRAMETLIGYHRDELTGRSTLEFDIFALPEERAEILRLLSEQGRINGMEAQIKTKGGITLTCLLYIETMNLQGKLYSLTQLVDVTEQRKMEKSLAETEYKYRTLVEQSPVVVYISDSDPENGPSWLYISPQVERLLGYTPDEYKADPSLWINGIHPDDAARIFQEAAESERQGLPVKLEYRIKTRDGHMIWVYDEAYQVLDPKSGKFVFHGIFYDITQRKWMENQIQESERNYRELVQNANSAIIRWKSDGSITFFNEYAQTFFGYPLDEIIGKPVDILVPPTDSAGGDLTKLVQNIVDHPENFVNVVNENICRDGRRVWMAWTNKPVYDEQGQVLEILAVGMDITERKLMEEELRRSNAELEQFAYVASHDLQEPLRTVTGMVGLLQQRYKGQLDERADEYIHFAVDASERMQQLINDLLDFSRVERKGKPFTTVKMENVLHTALANLQTAIAESEAHITHDPLPTVMADAGQLTQVLQNLISNAIKFREEKPPKIHISAEKKENGWQFAVRDNGIGIDPQYFERVFLIFQRLHTRSKYPGTGIGLALCKKIIERHGGKMWIESELKRGATFFFTIPERSKA